MAINKNKVMEGALKLAEKGAYDKAVKEYLKVVQEDPKDVRVWLKIGDLFAKKGAKQEATETYLKVAQLYTEQGFFLKAVAVYKQVLKLDPRLIDVNLKLASLYRQLQLPAEAMAQFEYVATFCHREGKPREAVAALQQILEIDPNNVATRIKLAELYSKEGESGDAIREFKVTADMLRQQGRTDDFIKVAERLVWHQPDNRALNRELAELYIKKNDARRAMQKLQACFKADPRDVETLALLASAFDQLGQSAKTISVLKELARIHQENGQPDKRVAVIQRIAQLSPEDTEVRALFGTPSNKSAGVPALPAAPPPPPPARSAPPPSLTFSGANAPASAPMPPMGMTGSMPIVNIDEPFPPRVATPIERDLASTEQRRVPSQPLAPTFRPAGTGGQRALPPAEGLRANDDFGFADAAPSIQTSDSRDVFEDAPGSDVQAGEDFGEEVAKVLAEADVYLKYGLHQKAIDHIKPIIARDGRNVEAHEKLKEVFLKVGRYDDAASALATLVEITGSARSEVAASYFSELVSMAPHDPRVRELADRFHLQIPEDPEPMALDARGSEPAPLEQREPSKTGKRVDPMGYGDEYSEELVVGDDDSNLIVEVPPLDEAPAETPSGRSFYPPELAPRLATATMRTRVPDTQELGGDTLDQDPDIVISQNDADTGVMSMADADALEEDDKPESPPQAEPIEPIDESGTNLEDDLDEADFFVQQNLYGEARAILESLLERYPNHPLVQAKLQDVEALSNVGQPEPEPAPPPTTHVDEQPQVYQLTQPRRNVVAKLGDDDIETHYDLGIAYKEMGLFDDAIKEFQVVMQLPGRAVQCAMMIGLCFAEIGQHTEAINQYKNALYEPQITEREALALYFELGQSYERLADASEALYYYEKVAKRDPRFREVGRRIHALKERVDADTTGKKPRAPDDLDHLP